MVPENWHHGKLEMRLGAMESLDEACMPAELREALVEDLPVSRVMNFVSTQCLPL